MIFVIDAQLPRDLCAWLERRGHPAHYVRDMLGLRAADWEIAAHMRGGIIITKDKDFVALARAGACRAIRLRCGNIKTYDLLAWLEPFWPAVERRLSLGERLIEIG